MTFSLLVLEVWRWDMIRLGLCEKTTPGEGNCSLVCAALLVFLSPCGRLFRSEFSILHMFSGTAATEWNAVAPDAACVPMVWFLSGPVSLISSDVGGLIGRWSLMMTMMFLAGLMQAASPKGSSCQFNVKLLRKKFSGPLNTSSWSSHY